MKSFPLFVIHLQDMYHSNNHMTNDQKVVILVPQKNEMIFFSLFHQYCDWIIGLFFIAPQTVIALLTSYLEEFNITIALFERELDAPILFSPTKYDQ